jgi:hypothetical protein
MPAGIEAWASLGRQMFRYNNRKDENGRKLSGAEIFALALSQIAVKRNAVLIFCVGSAASGGFFLPPLLRLFLGV